LLWRCDPTRVMASSFLMFLDHTQRRTKVGRTPLDEWSARRRDLYLTTYNTHNGQTSMPPVEFEPTISAGERPQTYALDRAATGTGNKMVICWGIWNIYLIIMKYLPFSNRNKSFQTPFSALVRILISYDSPRFTECSVTFHRRILILRKEIRRASVVCLDLTLVHAINAWHSVLETKTFLCPAK